MPPHRKITLTFIAAALRGPIAQSAVHDALVEHPGAIRGLAAPLAAGFLSVSDDVEEVLKGAALMGPTALQEAVLDYLAEAILGGPSVDPASPSPSSAPSSSQGGAPTAIAVPSPHCAAMAIRAISGIAPKADSCCPADAIDRLVGGLFARLDGSLAASLAPCASSDGAEPAGSAAIGSLSPDAGPAAQALGLLGKSKRVRPRIVARLTQMLVRLQEWSRGCSRVPSSGIDSPAAAPTSCSGPSSKEARRLRCALASALYDVAGTPGGRPDMASALSPLVALMSPSATAWDRNALGIAACALFRLTAHPPFLASLRETELPGFLRALSSSPTPLLHASAASAIASLQHSLAGGGLVGPKWRSPRLAPSTRVRGDPPPKGLPGDGSSAGSSCVGANDASSARAAEVEAAAAALAASL